MWWERTGNENLADFLPRLGSIAVVFECIYLNRPIWQSWLIEALQWSPPWLKVDATRTWPNESETDTNVNGGDKLRRPSQNSTQKQTWKIPNMLTYTNWRSTVHYSVGRTIWIRDTRPPGWGKTMTRAVANFISDQVLCACVLITCKPTTIRAYVCTITQYKKKMDRDSLSFSFSLSFCLSISFSQDCFLFCYLSFSLPEARNFSFCLSFAVSVFHCLALLVLNWVSSQKMRSRVSSSL